MVVKYIRESLGMKNELLLILLGGGFLLNVILVPTCLANDYYEEAFNEISKMLEGEEELSIRRAVFLSEWAFLEGKLDYEKDFCEPITQAVSFLKRLIAVNDWENYKTAKQIALCTFFFYPCSGNGYVPFRYDFSKEFPKDDWHYQLVSRTLKMHKGQCRSLPWTFILLAEELRADVSLAYAPRHCFVMYRNEDNLFPEEWVNVEVTTQLYLPTWSIKEYFAIKDSAVIQGTYLTPLSKKETIAKQLSDLAFGYYNKYHIYDDFTLKCSVLSLKHYKMNPNAIIIKARSLHALLTKHLYANGYRRDYTTDYIDAMLIQCERDLAHTYWTQETEELRKKWDIDEATLEERRKTIQYIN